MKVIANVILATILLACSCNATNHKDLAEAAVAKFRSNLSAEQYHSIYISADDAFRKNISEAEFVAVTKAVQQKLGSVQQSHLRYYVDGRATNVTGALLTIVYDTDFANGKGTEKFVWRIAKDTTLMSYSVNSDSLSR